MEFSRQEYSLPFSSPEDLPDTGIERESPTLLGRFFYHLSHQRQKTFKSSSVSFSVGSEEQDTFAAKGQGNIMRCLSSLSSMRQGSDTLLSHIFKPLWGSVSQPTTASLFQGLASFPIPVSQVAGD